MPDEKSGKYTHDHDSDQSGYGLRASRALVALAVLIALAGLAMSRYGFPVAGHVYTAAVVPLWDGIIYSAGSTLSLEVKLGDLPEKLTRWGQTLRIALRVAGPLLLGLAALAIRGRVKR
jgi:hypothetical protein